MCYNDPIFEFYDPDSNNVDELFRHIEKDKLSKQEIINIYGTKHKEFIAFLSYRVKNDKQLLNFIFEDEELKLIYLRETI
ncbi:MAG: hypothetical protein WCG16_05915 [Methylococcales bacterium]